MAITNAQLAQQVSELLDLWRVRELQFRAWLSGTASGGPYSDGRYPLQSYLDETYYVYSPAALANTVSGPAGVAGSHAASAQAARDSALAAQGAAESARNLALTYRDASHTARDLAFQYRDGAASHEANALTHRNAAVTARGGAELAETNAETAQATAEAARNSAQTHAANAATSAADAAASAAAAQTWNPANYLPLTGGGLVRHYADFRSRGQGRFTGWYAAPSSNEEGLALEVGASSGTAYVYSYNRAASAYGPLTLGGSGVNSDNLFTARANLIVETTGSTGVTRNIEFKSTGQSNVGYSAYAGTWRPSLTIQGETSTQYLFFVGPESAAPGNNARITSTRGIEVYAGGTYSFGANSNGYFEVNSWLRLGGAGQGIYSVTNDCHLYPNTTYAYGGWYIKGARSGYGGIVAGDVTGRPTLMFHSGASGLYWQDTSQWSFYSDQTNMHIYDRPLKGGNGALLYFVNSSALSGRVFVQQGGSPAGTAEGDITLIW